MPTAATKPDIKKTIRSDQKLVNIRRACEEAYNKVIAAADGQIVKRAQQIDMLTDMASAFDDGKYAILEGQTGGGKSLVFLITAISFAVTNKKQVVIATPHKNLQQQAIDEFYKWLKTSGDQNMRRGRVALLKGRKNYVSKAALEWLVSQYVNSPDRYEAMQEFSIFVDQSGGDLDFIRGNENIPEFLTSDDIDDLALPEEADPVDDHYLELAKRNAVDAHVVITNHALVLTYMQQRMYNQTPLLDMDHLIIDEAHTFISSAFNFLSNSIAMRTIRDQLRQLAQHVDNESFRGSIALSRKIQEVMAVASDVCTFLESAGQKLKSHGTHELYIRHLGAFQLDERMLHEVKKHTTRLTGALVDIKLGKYKKYFRKTSTKHTSNKLSDSIDLLRKFMEGFDENKRQQDTYFIMTFSKERSYPSFSKVIPSVGSTLYQNLWKHTRSVIFISGTLSDFNSSYAPFTGTRQKALFQHFRSELGLNMVRVPFLEYAYKRPFNFDLVNVHLYKDAPQFSVNEDEAISKATQKSLLEFSAGVIVKSLEDGKPKSQGGAMILVPAYDDIPVLLDSCDLRNKLPHRQIFDQSHAKNIQMCLSEFRQLPDPIKGLLIFTGGWMGLDLPGKQLTELFIPRIPRSNPQDPQVIARQNARERSILKYNDYRQKQGDPVMRYRDVKNYRGLFTEDVWKFKQGIGRLCRKEGDRGNIHIMDSRLFADGNFKHILNWLEKTFPHINRH